MTVLQLIEHTPGPSWVDGLLRARARPWYVPLATVDLAPDQR